MQDAGLARLSQLFVSITASSAPVERMFSTAGKIFRPDRARMTDAHVETYIGPVLVTVNPYKMTDLYSEQVTQIYRNINFYEEPPHIFAVADTAYRTMLQEHKDQCVLIAGESGAGKTEASKQILQHIASTCVTHSSDVERVKDRLLQSNPILEAFGNAKTNRNDNSSRFGKYMDIEFDFKGVPTGGVIVNYLLEKSRLCQQAPGECNFHVFYQLLAGADPETLQALELQPNTEKYFYMSQVSSAEDKTRDDSTDYTDLRAALDVCDFSTDEQLELLQVVAAILHLGNIGFLEEASEATINDFNSASVVAKLLGCDEDELCNALTQRTIAALEEVRTPLTRDHAISARDALAKAIYGRLFSWVVQRINAALVSEDKEAKHSVLGLLDVYGFEIFQQNSFEQFCINYCNEKLQQLFISLTLRSEQEEYLKEGIEVSNC
ncbi:Unconventional myosin IC [Lamellibrachia satsuma]|nr:Unconventional myosin IC [Lamellibrachia satsuma]